MKNNYEPNFSDPRVVKKVKQAIGFTNGVFSDTGSREWSRTGFDKHLGYSHTAIAQYLKAIVVYTTNDTFRFNGTNNKCKTYKLNTKGIKFLCDKLDQKTQLTWDQYKRKKTDDINSNELCKNAQQQDPIANDVKNQINKYSQEFIEHEYGHQLSAGLFVYKEASNRLFHPLQNFKTEVRHPVYVKYGYNYNYDIEAAAPSLLYQYARKCGMRAKCPALDDFLSDRTLFRIALAEILDVDLKISKKIFTALFSGAKLGIENSIGEMIDRDVNKMKLLQNSKYIIDLRKDIKKCWDCIKKSLDTTARLSPRDKWLIYFDLEKQVMKQVVMYLKKDNNKHFTEHDGWVCEYLVNVEQLRSFIKNACGYDVSFTQTKLSD